MGSQNWVNLTGIELYLFKKILGWNTNELWWKAGRIGPVGITKCWRLGLKSIESENK